MPDRAGTEVPICLDHRRWFARWETRLGGQNLPMSTVRLCMLGKILTSSATCATCFGSGKRISMSSPLRARNVVNSCSMVPQFEGSEESRDRGKIVIDPDLSPDLGPAKQIR